MVKTLHDDEIDRKETLHLIPFLFLCYFVAYLDRVNVGFAKLQMLADLKFSETVYGLGAGIFFIGYFIFEVPNNILLEKIGPRVWIARIMVTWGMLSSCMMFVNSELSYYALRFLHRRGGGWLLPGDHPLPDLLVRTGAARADRRPVHDGHCVFGCHGRPSVRLDHGELLWQARP
jgi:MFS family permease